jgi:hypothetical protein
MATPILNNWRLIGGGENVLGTLVGEVSGHPSLPDGWVITSAVAEIAEDRSWAQTSSRRYHLAMPLPDNQPLPPAAADAVLNRLLRNAGTLPSLAALERLAELAAKLSEPPVKQAD